MSLLQAKLLDEAQQAQAQEESDTRRQLVGSGDRSEKIRTYNYPQGQGDGPSNQTDSLQPT